MLRPTHFAATAVAAVPISLFASAAPVRAQGLDDIDITTAVERQFQADAAVPFNVIDVETIHGIVTRASVRPKSQLVRRGRHGQSGQVALRGFVDNLKAKQAAMHTAQNTVGVINVRNYLRVRPFDHYSDTLIDTNVRNALMRDALVDSNEVVIDVDNGMVNLYGLLDTVIEKNQAEDLASRTAGVTGVNNYLTVQRLDATVPVPANRGWYPFGYSYLDADPYDRDSEIAANMIEELFWSPYVDSADVTVTVDDGVATLTGTGRRRHPGSSAYSWAST